MRRFALSSTSGARPGAARSMPGRDALHEIETPILAEVFLGQDRIDDFGHIRF
jgi:hypothetical protein